MTTQTVQLSEQVAAGALAHMNEDHQENLLDYAQQFGGCDWAEAAEMTALRADGFDLAVTAGERTENITIAFDEPVTDGQSLRTALVDMAMKARQKASGEDDDTAADEASDDGLIKTAVAVVETGKASRYLKALCNHFDRKATAHYTDSTGHVTFPFGECDLNASDSALNISVKAESETMLNRMKHVVEVHLVKFGKKEDLSVTWQ